MGQFTEPPWSADCADFLYAVNGRSGQTTVAKLLPGAPAVLLAAAPELLTALDEALPLLEQRIRASPPGARQVLLLGIRTLVADSLAQARNGTAMSVPTKPRLWEIDAALPADERKANFRLLDAATELRDAAEKAYGVLYDLDDPAVTELRQALDKAAR